MGEKMNSLESTLQEIEKKYPELARKLSEAKVPLKVMHKTSETGGVHYYWRLGTLGYGAGPPIEKHGGMQTYEDRTERRIFDVKSCETESGLVIALSTHLSRDQYYNNDSPRKIWPHRMDPNLVLQPKDRIMWREEYPDVEKVNRYELVLLSCDKKKGTVHIQNKPLEPIPPNYVYLRPAWEKKAGRRVKLSAVDESNVNAELINPRDGSIDHRYSVNIQTGNAEEKELNKLRVLIVEDQELPLTVLIDAIKSVSPQYFDTVSYDINKSYCGAMDRIERCPRLVSPYDLVLLDHRLPYKYQEDLEQRDFDEFSKSLDNIGYFLIKPIKRSNPETLVVGTSSTDIQSDPRRDGEWFRAHNGVFCRRTSDYYPKLNPDFTLSKTNKATEDLDKIFKEIVRK
jgi:CheY-like chemotaxis protein